MTDHNKLISIAVCEAVNNGAKELNIEVSEEGFSWTFRCLDSSDTKDPFDTALKALVDFLETEREVMDLLYEWHPSNNNKTQAQINEENELLDQKFREYITDLFDGDSTNARIFCTDEGCFWRANYTKAFNESPIYKTVSEALISLVFQQEALINQQQVQINFLSNRRYVKPEIEQQKDEN